MGCDLFAGCFFRRCIRGVINDFFAILALRHFVAGISNVPVEVLSTKLDAVINDDELRERDATRHHCVGITCLARLHPLPVCVSFRFAATNIPL